MPNAPEVLGHIGIKVGDATDQLIGRLAGAQHGVVARRQLLALGIGTDVIQDRVENGRLIRLHRGVYAVGHAALTVRSRWMAAVLAAGPGAVLSHRSAAALWGVRKVGGGPIDVTVPAKRSRRRGIRLYESHLPEDEHETRDGIPVTTPARTLLDLAGVLRPQHFDSAYHEAEYLRLSSPVPLDALLRRHPRRPGAKTIREALAFEGRRRTRADMEAGFLAFCDANGLPRPDLANVSRVIHGRHIEADAVYLRARLIVELDGGSHRTTRRFHADRARDRANLAGGWRTIRVTSRHLDFEREELAADLRRLLP